MSDPVFDLLDDMLTQHEVECRGLRFRDEDDAYEHFRQLDEDDAAWQQQLDLEREQQVKDVLERCAAAGADPEDLKVIARECGLINWNPERKI